MSEKELPEITQPKKRIPRKTNVIKEIPEISDQVKEMPVVTEAIKPLPPVMDPENVVTINDVSVELKPTKIKYQRDRTAAFYHIVEIYPLPDILAMEAGIIDPARDGDKCLFDWLIACFDDPEFVTKHYEDMDSDLIDKILAIFKRLNKITDKEEHAKNKAAKETTL